MSKPTQPTTTSENTNAQIFWLIMGLFFMFLIPVCMLALATSVAHNW